MPRTISVQGLTHSCHCCRAIQRTKIFQYCTCPAGRMTYNFHSTCKLRHLSFKSVCNKEHKGVIWLPRVILPKALVLQDECFDKNHLSFLDFTRNYEQASGIFVPCNTLSHIDLCQSLWSMKSRSMPSSHSACSKSMPRANTMQGLTLTAITAAEKLALLLPNRLYTE